MRNDLGDSLYVSRLCPKCHRDFLFPFYGDRVCNDCKFKEHHVVNQAWRIPRTAVLVAKTCTDCGQFLEAHHFRRNGRPGRRFNCITCMTRPPIAFSPSQVRVSLMGLS